MDLFNEGAFELSGGRRSPFKIDCDGVGVTEWWALAAMLASILPPFATVEEWEAHAAKLKAAGEGA